MCFATVEDLTGTMDVILFPKVLETTRANMLENDVVREKMKKLVDGKGVERIIQKCFIKEEKK